MSSHAEIWYFHTPLFYMNCVLALVHIWCLYHTCYARHISGFRSYPALHKYAHFIMSHFAPTILQEHMHGFSPIVSEKVDNKLMHVCSGNTTHICSAPIYSRVDQLKNYYHSQMKSVHKCGARKMAFDPVVGLPDGKHNRDFCDWIPSIFSM